MHKHFQSSIIYRFECELIAMCHGSWMMFIDLFRFEFSLTQWFMRFHRKWCNDRFPLISLSNRKSFKNRTRTISNRISEIQFQFLIRTIFTQHLQSQMIEIDSFFMSNQTPSPPHTHTLIRCFQRFPLFLRSVSKLITSDSCFVSNLRIVHCSHYYMFFVSINSNECIIANK